MNWKIVIYECGHYGICWLVQYWESFWPSCEVISDGENMLVAWSGRLTFCDQSNGYFIEWSFWYLCHLQRARLNLGFFPVAQCTVSYVFPDVLIHTFPAVLMFYEALCMSSSLVTKFVMCFHKHCVFPCFRYDRGQELLVWICDMFIE